MTDTFYDELVKQRIVYVERSSGETADHLRAVQAQLSIEHRLLVAALRALADIRAEVEPVRTRRVRRNGAIKARCDAVLATETAQAWLREEGQDD